MNLINDYNELVRKIMNYEPTDYCNDFKNHVMIWYDKYTNILNANNVLDNNIGKVIFTSLKKVLWDVVSPLSIKVTEDKFINVLNSIIEHDGNHILLDIPLLIAITYNRVSDECNNKFEKKYMFIQQHISKDIEQSNSSDDFPFVSIDVFTLNNMWYSLYSVNYVDADTFIRDSFRNELEFYQMNTELDIHITDKDEANHIILPQLHDEISSMYKIHVNSLLEIIEGVFDDSNFTLCNYKENLLKLLDIIDSNGTQPEFTGNNYDIIFYWKHNKHVFSMYHKFIYELLSGEESSALVISTLCDLENITHELLKQFNDLGLYIVSTVLVCILKILINTQERTSLKGVQLSEKLFIRVNCIKNILQNKKFKVIGIIDIYNLGYKLDQVFNNTVIKTNNYVSESPLVDRTVDSLKKSFSVFARSVKSVLPNGIKVTPTGEIRVYIDNNKTFMEQYASNHRLLVYNQTKGDYDAMKYNLAYNMLLIDNIDKVLYDKNIPHDSEIYKDAVKAKRFFNNDINTYLGKIKTHEPNFNLNELYEIVKKKYNTYEVNAPDTITGVKKIISAIVL